MSFRSFFRSHSKALGSFGAMQIMQLLLPLLALPWLARMLGPDVFGLLMYFCLFPPLIAMFMDWGLAVGGGRKAAGCRGDHNRLARLLAAVLTAKIILCIACIALCACIAPALPHAAEYPLAYALAVTAGIARGMNPSWFFQGAGYGLPRMAAWDAGASLGALILVFGCIHQPETWQLYLLFITLCKSLAYGYLLFTLCFQYRPQLRIKEGMNALLRTAALFGSAFSLMFCYNGGQIVLGYFLPEQDMGIIAACMKMLRALASLVFPFTQTLFPELCIWRKECAEKARNAARISLAASALAACCAVALATILAPWLIKLALGTAYIAAAPVLRFMLTATPFMVCNNVLACQILVPHGKEKAQLSIQVFCAFLVLPLAALLAVQMGLLGGAILPLCCEMAMTTGFLFSIWRLCPEALFKSSSCHF